MRSKECKDSLNVLHCFSYSKINVDLLLFFILSFFNPQRYNYTNISYKYCSQTLNQILQVACGLYL